MKGDDIVNKYVIGMDFGTLSGRFILVDVNNGNELATVVLPYKHGVMESELHGHTLPFDYALQDAQDYLEVLEKGVKQVIAEAGVNTSSIIGIGVDFTASTVLPVDENLKPLSAQPQFRLNPHAYVKLWKHHAAQPQADKAVRVAKERKETFIKRYGNQITSEWLVPKVMEIADEDPELYDLTHRFLEGGDFIVSSLVGKEVRSSCQAGYKALWHKKDGYPSNAYFKALHPKLDGFVQDKLAGEVKSIGDTAGPLSKTYADLLGLKANIPVAVAYIDAHSAVPALGITDPGKLLMILGTSTCHMVLDQKEHFVEGISGVVEDGIIPGYFGYEAGQACVGNALEWWVDNFVPKRYYDQAEALNLSIYDYLNHLAEQLVPGENGLLALDWLNGNRSILSNSNLTGVIMGLNLLTRPEDIYRALIESTAFGAKVIIEQFEKQGVLIDALYATGGISKKSPLFMQIYADVTGRPIYIGKSDQAVALGSAILASVAAGKKAGGYETIDQAAKAMGNIEDTVYEPIKQNYEVYQELFTLFKRTHDRLGIKEDTLITLKSIRNKSKRGGKNE